MQSHEYTYKQGDESEELLVDIHWRLDSPHGGFPGHPIVIIFHGGGFVQGSKAIIPRTEIESLCRLGFVAVVPNYRLCPQISVYDGPVVDSLDCLKWTVFSLPAILSQDFDDIHVDTGRITLMGHSAGATLALLAANSPASIAAVLDFYGGKYYSDPIWHSPTPFFANAPDYPESLAQQVFSGPQMSAATPSLNTDEITPRDAWLSNAFKSGKHLSLVTKDGNYNRIDAAGGFSSAFPPTMFIHGTADTVTPSQISQRAYEELKRLGVEAHLVLVEGENHMFDMFYSEKDEIYWKYVMRGFEFLASKVGLL